jgi:hypothetical protein
MNRRSPLQWLNTHLPLLLICGAICALLASANTPFMRVFGFASPAMKLSTINDAQKPQAKTQVMILGVYHFDNPNLDYVKSNVDDHLSAKRQQQIAEVVEMLAKFKPTKIALEAVDGTSSIPRNYEAYLKGEYTLHADERDQLGLRLAKQLGHQRVYGIDHKLDMDFEGVMKAAQQSNNTAFLETLQRVLGELQEFQKRQATLTVREILAFHNDPKNIVKGRDLYLQMARVRNGDRFVGADVLASWYQRNFRIFTNLAQVIESPDDRVLVIYGSGHSAILRELIESDPTLHLVEPNDYLAPRK